eukprot:TRINITY_DN10776_c0_g1_i2.p3 TRINITY_DN10776_c0_g1~~TRINITY_DN10776_c0_g1_i2.p3  ORF type:complete len:159 (+),score=10.73 TRINITY_DN10776_c0_g1_i2:2010-2486(+)
MLRPSHRQSRRISTFVAARSPSHITSAASRQQVHLVPRPRTFAEGFQLAPRKPEDTAQGIFSRASLGIPQQESPPVVSECPGHPAEPLAAVVANQVPTSDLQGLDKRTKQTKHLHIASSEASSASIPSARHNLIYSSEGSNTLGIWARKAALVNECGT